MKRSKDTYLSINGILNLAVAIEQGIITAFLEGETMTKPRDCLDWVSFWRKALAAVLLIIFAAAVSPGRASETDFTDQFGVSYSKFWSSTNLYFLYGYGYEKDLSDLYGLLSALEAADPSFTNPMKRMPEVYGPSMRTFGWDYADPQNSEYRKYCTNFVGAVILMRLLTFDDAVFRLSLPALNANFGEVWDNYKGTSVWILMTEADYTGKMQTAFPEVLSTYRDTICRNVLFLLFRTEFMNVNVFVRFNPHSEGPYMRWIIEEKKVRGAIQ